uniref:Uncharacterized protein n=1 Tax=Anguilla anguilla TaxID=7936 RepID=A0A0E9P6Q1_ANGAN
MHFFWQMLLNAQMVSSDTVGHLPGCYEIVVC